MKWSHASDTRETEGQRYLNDLNALPWSCRDDSFTAEGHLFRPGEGRQHPPMLRRCSWQTIIRVMGQYEDLTWLVTGLGQKYGLNPA